MLLVVATPNGGPRNFSRPTKRYARRQLFSFRPPYARTQTTVNLKSIKWCIAKDNITPKDIFQLAKGSSSDRAIVAKYKIFLKISPKKIVCIALL